MAGGVRARRTRQRLTLHLEGTAMMKKLLRCIAATGVLTLSLVQQANANMPVFDASNFIQNTMTAAAAVKGEVYQDSNLVYQYQMMLNQLKQATNLNPAAMLAQFNSISSDITSLSKYTDALKDLYGGLQSNAEYATKVQSLITQSGKTPDQWFADQNTLLQSNDKTAKQLFQQGNDVMSHVSTLAQRRQQIQDQLNMSPTMEATAQLTTHMLDIISSQNSDLLSLMAAKQRSDAVKDSATVAEQQVNNNAQAALKAKQDRERAAFDASIGSATKLGQ
ncbi:type VI secretion protein [Caballeronia sp. LZ001]|uniref:type VI secretion protein n=2 Tax=Caballeronia TaxID=1827195 RepID=UPI002865238F|nr:type VI secretion protein [Caballeronia sp. LZ001]MDR5777101.1 type VI secretion protein [Caballeronia sp. LZ002]MDR5798745.1 type VI secretion protein [Caballeronia sp. LZ001]